MDLDPRCRRRRQLLVPDHVRLQLRGGHFPCDEGPGFRSLREQEHGGKAQLVEPQFPKPIQRDALSRFLVVLSAIPRCTQGLGPPAFGLHRVLADQLPAQGILGLDQQHASTATRCVEDGSPATNAIRMALTRD